MEYLRERRKELGVTFRRSTVQPALSIPRKDEFPESFESSGDREVSTTMAFVRMFGRLLRHKDIGKLIVPIVPDESRTFGMESLFRQCGIYAHTGQLYEPVDSETVLYYREAKDGQILEEGITEAGSMSSFIAAGTSYSTHGICTIPFFIFYSMFGFQRIGDLIWAAADQRAKGFMMGGTAGRTTLNGEGLQHQDGHTHLFAMAYPTVRCYDPAYAYETAYIVLEGMRHMYEDQQDALYYITIGNENYLMPNMPEGCEEGIMRGMYRVSTKDVGNNRPHVQLFGSGAILREALRAQTILAEKYDISSTAWSVTSYKQLRTDAQEARRWNLLHPTETAAAQLSGKRAGRRAGPVHRHQRLRAGGVRTDRPVDSRRPARARDGWAGSQRRSLGLATTLRNRCRGGHRSHAQSTCRARRLR